MGKKMNLLPSLFKRKQSPDNCPWQWQLCGHSETPSFRAGDQIFKTVNSVFFDHVLPDDRVQTPDSWFTNSSLSESESFSTESDDEFEAKTLEMVVRGAKSERLIFEPGESNSILQKPTEEVIDESIRFEESVVLAMESEDPYLDFRGSMEEMIESQGIGDWECLEELLNWYLRVNRTKNHGYILCAFVDLLVDLGGGDGSDSTDSKSVSSDKFIDIP